MKKEEMTARAWIEIDRKNLSENVRLLQGLLPCGCRLMPAVKANAYGHGAVPVTRELNRLGIREFCVASASEGVELRKAGVKGEILILGYTHPDLFPLLRRYRLSQTVIDASYAELLSSYGKKADVHIKIDTGMRRLGERSENVKRLCELFSCKSSAACKNLNVKGTFTHLCCDESRSPADKAFTYLQARRFYEAVNMLESHGVSCGKKHLLASSGLINYPEIGGDYVRAGIALYGVLSSRNELEGCRLDLRPVLSVKARVAAVKELYAGEGAGYGLTYTADAKRKIAVVSVGYADGIPRSLSNGCGRVLINGKAAPIVGRVCMDQLLADVTEIEDAKSGDIAVLIGKSGESEITAYDLAEASASITNEVLSRLGNRLVRFVV